MHVDLHGNSNSNAVTGWHRPLDLSRHCLWLLCITAKSSMLKASCPGCRHDVLDGSQQQFKSLDADCNIPSTCQATYGNAKPQGGHI
jgi:hypothetical protein